MRTFLRDHWKAIVAILLLVVLATFTVTPGAARVISGPTHTTEAPPAAPAGKAAGGSDEHTHR